LNIIHWTLSKQLERLEQLKTTEIAEHFDFTLPAVSFHLRILKDADLITEKKHGKNSIIHRTGREPWNW
jgi:DNA-binding transcriptional ArsR family regulator